MYKAIILIPFYNHFDQFLMSYQTVKQNELGLPVLIVNDGSDLEQSQKLEALCSEQGFFYLALEKNQGKGKAVVEGMRWALNNGYTHVVQIDADGQHDVGDIAKFISVSQENPDALICGCPIYDHTVPKSRLYGREVTNFWVTVETFFTGNVVKDSLCGFRIYPLNNISSILDSLRFMRMGFDAEIAVKFVWNGVNVINIPTKVIYPSEGLSHFHVIRDNIFMVFLHTYLCLLLPTAFLKRKFQCKMRKIN